MVDGSCVTGNPWVEGGDVSAGSRIGKDGKERDMIGGRDWVRVVSVELLTGGLTKELARELCRNGEEWAK
jgi:hypothetical protein